MPTKPSPPPKPKKSKKPAAKAVPRLPVDPPDPPDPPSPPPHPPHPPPPPFPPFPPSPPPGPVTSSITSWTRLEPHCRDADMRASLGARVFDPLWMLTRQWQVGEFQAEDTGMPVMARLRATSARFSRCALGPVPHDVIVQAPPYEPRQVPLEAMVERRTMRPASETDARMLGFVVEAGLHFLHLLEAQPLSKSYRAVFVTRFALQAPASPPSPDAADPATTRWLQTMTGRALDARRLAAALRTGGAAALTADTVLKIAVQDKAEVGLVASTWLAWYDAFATEPDASTDAWIPDRMEYSVSIAARLSPQPFDEVTLSADAFDDGRLDWTAFDVNVEINMSTTSDQTTTAIVETVVPSPVTFRGTPAPRFWELEDARIDYGLMPVGPTDLAHLLMIEYTSGYGNDWFVVPVTMPIGSVTRVDSLVVTDSFGVRSLLRPIGDAVLPKPYWSMWQMAHRRRAGQTAIRGNAGNLFFLPPSTGQRLEGGAVEDVLFMRDEMANLAWAIERSVESPLEQPMQRVEREPVPNETPVTADAPPRYRLSSTVPPHWIPLMPIQTRDTDGTVITRLKRGAVLQPDGSQEVHHALSEALDAAGDLLLYDEEVPREGSHVIRRRVLARWVDGSTWLWTGFRKQVGTGEGSSGLVFDQLLGDERDDSS